MPAHRGVREDRRAGRVADLNLERARTTGLQHAVAVTQSERQTVGTEAGMVPDLKNATI